MSVTDDDRTRRWGLNGHDLRKLRRALPGVGAPRHLRRLQALLLLAAGRSLRTICLATHLTRQSVYNALHRYRRHHRVEDLADRPRRGRPKAAKAITDRRIRAVLELDPRSVGFNATTWTVDLLSKHLCQRHGQKICRRTLRRRMHALGLRWKRPRYVYHLKDPNKAQKKGALCGG
jgi:transposase